MLRWVATDAKENRLTVQKADGEQVSYDPSRLLGISAYREIEREFAIGDRLQFTAPNRELGVANRDLGTIEHINQDGQLAVRMDGGKAVAVRRKRDAPLRSRLCRDLAQLAGTHRGSAS